MLRIASVTRYGRTLRAALRKAAAIGAVGAVGTLGAIGLGISPSSAAQPPPPPPDPMAFGTEPGLPSFNPATLTSLNAKCPEAIAGTPGSAPATKYLNSVLNTPASFEAGGTIHYYYGDNANFASTNFQIDDCVAVYAADKFALSDFNEDGQLLSTYSKSDLNDGVKIDSASFSGVLDSTGRTYFTWTAPTNLVGGQWVCNFARDIATGHGGGGNRKVLPTCYQAVQRVTPAPATYSTTTVCGAEDTYTIPETTGVTYRVNGTDTAAGTYYLPTASTVTITAVANPNFYFPSGTTTSWGPFIGSVVEPCIGPLTPIAPTHTVNTACGVEDTYTIPTMTGVIYSPAPGAYTLPAGQTVVITAAAAVGSTLAVGAPASWSFTGSEVPTCTTIVTPASPSHSVSTACGVEDSYTVPAMTGVVYSPAPGTYPLPAGSTVDITAAPASADYVFALGSTGEWSFTGSVVETCQGDPDPVIIVAGPDPTTTTTTTSTTVPPTTTTTEPEPESEPEFELAFTPDPEPEVIATTAAAPETTTTTAAPQPELAFTGSSNTLYLALIGFGMLGLGALLIAASRRKPNLHGGTV